MCCVTRLRLKTFVTDKYKEINIKVTAIGIETDKVIDVFETIIESTHFIFTFVVHISYIHFSAITSLKTILNGFNRQ